MTKSQIEKGADNVERLRKLLKGLEEANKPLPNKTAIARSCDFDRQVLYQNPTAVALLDQFEKNQLERDSSPLTAQAIDDEGMSGLPKGLDVEIRKRMDRLVAEISSLRALLAESEAKNLALRRQLASENSQSAMLAETGMTLRTSSFTAGEDR